MKEENLKKIYPSMAGDDDSPLKGNEIHDFFIKTDEICNEIKEMESAIKRMEERIGISKHFLKVLRNYAPSKLP